MKEHEKEAEKRADKSMAPVDPAGPDSSEKILSQEVDIPSGSADKAEEKEVEKPAAARHEEKSIVTSTAENVFVAVTKKAPKPKNTDSYFDDFIYAAKSPPVIDKIILAASQDE